MSDTETTETPEAPQEGEHNPEVTGETEPTTEGPEDGDNPGKEAAKYRRRLREAEKERDGLAGQLEAMRRATAEQVAGAVLAKPSALWAAGTQVADLLAEDGTIDAEKVTAAATAARESLGLAQPPRGNYSPREGNSPRVGSGAPRFEDALRQH